MRPRLTPREPLLLACDLDGTLLDHASSPVPGVSEVLGELVAAGVLFVVCTGRPLHAARRATTSLGVEPLVYACFHGALITTASGQIIRHLPVPPAAARSVADEALVRGLGVTVWGVDEPRELGTNHSPANSASGAPAPSTVTDGPGGVGGFDQVSRLVLYGDPAVAARLLVDLRTEWAGRLRVEPIRPGFVGVVAPDVDKGAALQLIARRLGVRPGRTIACGDGAGDETLLAAAAVRIAVGEPPHVLGHLPDVVVARWPELPAVLRARVLALL